MTTRQTPIRLYGTDRTLGEQLDTLIESVAGAADCPVEFTEEVPEEYRRGSDVGGFLTSLPLELVVVIPLQSLAAAVANAAVAWARERVKDLREPIEVTLYVEGKGFWGSEKIRTITVKPKRRRFGRR